MHATHHVILLTLAQVRQLAGGLAFVEQRTAVIDQNELVKVRWAPHHFERDPRFELQMSHVGRRLAVAAKQARAP